MAHTHKTPTTTLRIPGIPPVELDSHLYWELERLAKDIGWTVEDTALAAFVTKSEARDAKSVELVLRYRQAKETAGIE